MAGSICIQITASDWAIYSLPNTNPITTYTTVRLLVSSLSCNLRQDSRRGQDRIRPTDSLRDQPLESIARSSLRDLSKRQGGWLTSALTRYHDKTLTDDTSKTADKTKTGSAAASKKSYFAIKARKGIINKGTIIIRLMTATNTVLFSPGYAAD